MNRSALPENLTESRYRLVRGAMWMWLLVLVLCIVVPKMLNGWNGRALIQDAAWRIGFGAFLIASGVAYLAFWRTIAAAAAIHARRSWFHRLQRRLAFGDRREASPDVLYKGYLLTGLVSSVFLVFSGIAFCADWIPHPP